MENKKKAEAAMLDYENQMVTKAKQNYKQKIKEEADKKKTTEVITNEYDLEWSIYEMLNNLDYALSGEEIKDAQADFFKNLKKGFDGY